MLHCALGQGRAWPAGLRHSPLRRACVLQLLRPEHGGLLWRTCKADLDPQELGIPPQTAHTTQLAFSAVERYFYNHQHQVAACQGNPAWLRVPGIGAAAGVPV